MTKILSNKSSVSLDYPICRPSLNLDFTQEVLDERITFSRGSIGTRVNRNRLIETVSANTPRFDYDPVTGECKGLLIEESRQNLLLQSNGFDTASWSKNSVTHIPNSIISPDGTTTAYKSVENTTTNLHRTSQIVSKSAVATTYTFSIFVKSGERNGFEFGMGDASGYIDCFANLTTGTFTGVPVVNGSWILVSYGSVSYPNGWYRFYVSSTTTAQTSVLPFFGTTRSLGVANVYTGDGTSGIYIWGAQLETGAFPTTYIPTVASTVTRSADTATMTGTNFSSWYNQTEGTIYTNNRIPYTPNPNVSLFFTITNLSPFSRHSVEQTTANGLSYFNQNGSGIQGWSTSGSGVLPANTNRKTTYSYSSSNNTTLLSGTSNETYNFSQKSRTDVNKSMTGLYFGVFINILYLNGTIARFTYYPRALKPNQLQYLTQ